MDSLWDSDVEIETSDVGIEDSAVGIETCDVNSDVGSETYHRSVSLKNLLEPFGVCLCWTCCFSLSQLAASWRWRRLGMDQE